MSTPSPYRNPNHVPPDRRNARRATLHELRKQYFLREDDLFGDPADGFRAPPYLPALPEEEKFSARKLGNFLSHKMQGLANAKVPMRGIRRAEDFRRMFTFIPTPSVADRWADDVDFARRRLQGVNPMAIRALHAAPPRALAEAADRVLKAQGGSLTATLDAGRLYETDYSALVEPRIQSKATASGRHLSAARCLFAVGADGVLRPLAIQLWPHDHPGENPVYTPLDDPWAWQLAKWHAQTSDGCMHEGVYHLFETHLVTEVITVCAHRNLHPDHPILHLLKPHLSFTLAIDVLARKDMLAPGKAIDLALSAGAAGALNAIRMWFNSGWSWWDRCLERELAARGVGDGLPGYHYRDDARVLRGILADYVTGVIRPFYLDDADVGTDAELQGWLQEAASHLPGFPAAVASFDELAYLLTEIVFRASVQHAAVNNGQFDAYGYVPAAPGAMFAPPPTKASYTEEEAVAALPRGAGAFAQLAMAWVLSEPSHYGILGLGHSPAFSAERCPAAREAVARARRRLAVRVNEVDRRNAELAVPYLYLDPRNIECSTGT